MIHNFCLVCWSLYYHIGFPIQFVHIIKGSLQIIFIILWDDYICIHRNIYVITPFKPYALVDIDLQNFLSVPQYTYIYTEESLDHTTFLSTDRASSVIQCLPLSIYKDWVMVFRSLWTQGLFLSWFVSFLQSDFDTQKHYHCRSGLL